jgi:hypothetical protein
LSIENISLPALVELFNSGFLSDTQIPWIIVTQTVIFMLSGNSVNRLPTCFRQRNDPMFSRIAMDLKSEVFGFDENLFLENSNGTEPPQEVVDLRKALRTIPDNGFEPQCQGNQAPPGVCVLLMRFDSPPLGATCPGSSPPERCKGPEGARGLQYFSEDYLSKGEERDVRLEHLGRAMGTVVDHVLRAIPGSDP